MDETKECTFIHVRRTRLNLIFVSSDFMWIHDFSYCFLFLYHYETLLGPRSELFFVCLLARTLNFSVRACVLHCFSNIRLIGYSSLTNLCELHRLFFSHHIPLQNAVQNALSIQMSKFTPTLHRLSRFKGAVSELDLRIEGSTTASKEMPSGAKVEPLYAGNHESQPHPETSLF